MVETDWKEILSFSQRELTLADKEKLCEGLCWMEADDIELNFTDLKTLFRLAQDILKLKSEQVNNLVGQLKTTQRKSSKTKIESPYAISPTQSNDSALETITHQEEIIRANKEILEQLYADIADLESRKSKLKDSRSNLDIDSESSRDVLSEMNEVAELEREVTMKNKHIRKLLNDVKILEDENTNLKGKVSVLKDKLTEATQLINNFTEQIVNANNECIQLKEILGKTEQKKVQLSVEIEDLRRLLISKDSTKDNIYEEVKSKLQHWKNTAKSMKAEIETLSSENARLRKNILESSKITSLAVLSPKKNNAERLKIKELQDKLVEASAEIEKTANIIEMLRAENRHLKNVIEEAPDCSTSDIKNESDDGKQRILIKMLKKKVEALTHSLQDAEEMIGAREKELTEITSQLQLLRTDEGINALLEGMKNKKRQLKLKNEDIKALVKETNALNQLIDKLQLENETLRQKYNIPPQENISTKGIIKYYRNLKDDNINMSTELKKLENKLITIELNNRNLKSQILDLNQQGHTKKLDQCAETYEGVDVVMENSETKFSRIRDKQSPSKSTIIKDEKNHEKEILILIEENKGLRQGLQEVLDFLKDHSKFTSDVITLECPSLEAILISMEARNSAGWFAPHMSTVMELRAALGGKDALLNALKDSRKETFTVMTQLSDVTKKYSQLEQKLNEIEEVNKPKQENDKLSQQSSTECEFGSWITEKEEEEISMDFYDISKIENLVNSGNIFYEKKLKKGLEYFHKKFKDLFDKLTVMVIQTTDNCNKWSIQEERYKAEIENLKGQLQQENEDFSDCSPGMIPISNTNSLQRKCSYLEESYRHIRTVNENMKNEILENKKRELMATSEYEIQIQKLILSITDLTEKLNRSISFELFWKQNLALNEINSKYRKLMEKNVSNQTYSQNILKYLDDGKMEILTRIQGEYYLQNDQSSKHISTKENIELTILKTQIQQLTSKMEDKIKEVRMLENTVVDLQNIQGKLIDENLASISKDEVNFMKEQIEKLTNHNKMLKEQCHHVSSQLDIALIQLQNAEQRQLNNDMEINMLQHQILDLQSTSDNKAIIARLSGEILIAHLQLSESHKKIEQLDLALNKEREIRDEIEEMLRVRQKIFDIYSLRYNSKFRYIYEVMATLRQQYQGCIPLASIECYLNKMEELCRKNHAVDEKLSEIEDLREGLITKHSIFEQILDASKGKCVVEEDSCPHKLKHLMAQSVHARELEHINKKLKTTEQSRDDLVRHCNYLEKTIILVSQGFGKSAININFQTRPKKQGVNKDGEGNEEKEIELAVIQSEAESSSSHRSKTITLTKPQMLQQVLKTQTQEIPDVEDKSSAHLKIDFAHVYVQTISTETKYVNKLIQTEEYKIENEMKRQIGILENNIHKKTKELSEAMTLIQQRSEEILHLNKDKITLEHSVQHLKDSNNQTENSNERLRMTISELQIKIDELKTTQTQDSSKLKDMLNEENKSLLIALKQLENDKNTISTEYKELLNKEREEYTKSVKELYVQIMDLQSKLDRRGSESSVSSGEALKKIVAKYTMKITELEDKCFKLQSELDDCKSELSTYQSESDRWKELAAERLMKMEQLNLQLEERHCEEVNSYKAENQHWLSQLNDMQREHVELRTRLTDQKTAYIKQLAEKDTQIEQLRVVTNGLKTQVLNMQTLISINDPSFDLSAIVEVDETSDGLSNHGSDRLELKFDTTVDPHESLEDIVRIPASSTTIWQEPIIERLRRDKQLFGKQNAILRRQIKVLASRERRARLDAQNLKNQVFRISTTGNKVTTAETAALHSKIVSLQAQLTSARRDTHSSIALWDKWKRSQQAADRWQARYEEKCQEVIKLQAGVHLAKSTVGRLEKEKRVLLSRLSEAKSENQLSATEKQDAESPEKSNRSSKESVCNELPLPVSSQALLDRVQAQQRRIAALEFAEKGNEFLVSEYERALAEITSLKGQVLKMESALLESQIRTPMKSTNDAQPELDYWKSYCEMLKEENIQLTQKINSIEMMPTTTHQHRISDLEQTVLTLRGVINKLQSEQKSGATYKRADPRPGSTRSSIEKGRTQLESHRIEIVNLKRTIHDKDLLLEKSKEMLKISAEREEELLRENTYLRRQLDEFTRPKQGFLSA